jgi:hypothetical protein
MRKSNLTYNELIELAPKDRPFQIEVESDAWGNGWAKILWASILDDKLDTTICNQRDIEGYEYGVFYPWELEYKGTFNLIDEYRNMYEKPEVLEEGTEVEILESSRDCGIYDEEDEEYIGKVGKIVTVEDLGRGLCYKVQFNHKLFYPYFPHYCVRPVEKVEEKEEDTITVNGKKYKLIEK